MAPRRTAVKPKRGMALSVYVLAAIIKKQLRLDLSLYKILQILSVTVFEKTPILEGFSNACSPRTNEVLRREMARVLAGFATFWQFFTRVYTHLHAGQDVWQTDIQGLQQITAGRIRHGDAQASTALFEKMRTRHESSGRSMPS